MKSIVLHLLTAFLYIGENSTSGYLSKTSTILDLKIISISEIIPFLVGSKYTQNKKTIWRNKTQGFLKKNLLFSVSTLDVLFQVII